MNISTKKRLLASVLALGAFSCLYSFWGDAGAGASVDDAIQQAQMTQAREAMQRNEMIVNVVYQGKTHQFVMNKNARVDNLKDKIGNKFNMKKNHFYLFAKNKQLNGNQKLKNIQGPIEMNLKMVRKGW